MSHNVLSYVFDTAFTKHFVHIFNSTSKGLMVLIGMPLLSKYRAWELWNWQKSIIQFCLAQLIC